MSVCFQNINDNNRLRAVIFHGISHPIFCKLAKAYGIPSTKTPPEESQESLSGLWWLLGIHIAKRMQ